MKRRHSWFWRGEWMGIRPFIGADEYWQHTVTVKWPFAPRIDEDGTRLYRGLTIRLPSTCLDGLTDELDQLRAEVYGTDDEHEAADELTRMRYEEGL